MRTLTGSTTGVNITSCVDRLDDSTGLIFVFFFSSMHGQSWKLFFSPSTVLHFQLGFLGWVGLSPDDIHFPRHAFPSTSIFIDHIINITRTTKPRTHASIHAHALVPSLHPSHIYTHSLQVYILGRSFDSSLLFKFILGVQLSL